MDAADIATHLGLRSKAQVIGKAHRMNLPKKGKSRDEWQSAPSSDIRIKRPEPPPGGLTLMQLGEHHCRWPLTDNAPWFFCGHDAEGTYCAKHHRIAFTKGSGLPFYKWQ